MAGSFVQSFLNFGSLVDSSLVVYIQEGSKAETLINCLIHDEQYVLDEELTDWDDRPIYERRTASNQAIDQEKPSIKIVKISGPPVAGIIRDACTTACLCFMSWNKLYCLLPVLTVVRHKMLTSSNLTLS